MLRRRFGKTGLDMPVLSCGGMRYQFRWQDVAEADIPRLNQQNLAETIERALSCGINHVETARAYGSSERQLGLVLPSYPRTNLIVQTKLIAEQNPQRFEQNFLESLARLQLKHVDLLSIHGVNSRESFGWSTRAGGCFDVAQSLRKRGLCHAVGVSTHGTPDLVLDLVRFISKQGESFDYLNLHWYFIFQRNWQAIVEAAQRDMGIFIISPTDKGGKLYAPPPKLVELCEPLSPIVFNNLFCLSHPQVHTLSVGAARPSDFDEHLKVLPLLADGQRQLGPILKRLASAMQEATGNASPEAGLERLPPREQTYGGYHLSVILWLLNLAQGWDMIEYGKMRFNLLGSGDSWFPGERPRSGQALDEVALLKSLQGYPDAARVPSLLREAVRLLEGADQKRLSQS